MLKLARRAFLAKYWVLRILKISIRGLKLMNCIVAIRYLLFHLILPVYHFQSFHSLFQSVNHSFIFLCPARISDPNTQRSTKSSFCWIRPGWLFDQNQRKLDSEELGLCSMSQVHSSLINVCCYLPHPSKSKSLCNYVCVCVCVCVVCVCVCVWCLVLWQILTHGHTLSLHDTHKTQYSLKTDQCIL